MIRIVEQYSRLPTKGRDSCEITFPICDTGSIPETVICETCSAL